MEHNPKLRDQSLADIAAGSSTSLSTLKIMLKKKDCNPRIFTLCRILKYIEAGSIDQLVHLSRDTPETSAGDDYSAYFEQAIKEYHNRVRRLSLLLKLICTCLLASVLLLLYLLWEIRNPLLGRIRF